MSVYRIAEDGFEPLRETSFEAEKFYERPDMQRMLRNKPAGTVRRLTLDEAWPVHSAGAWPEGLSLRREDICEERV